jgi:hypothetical protein
VQRRPAGLVADPSRAYRGSEGPLADGKQGWRIGAATRLDGAPHFPALVLELEEIWAG